MAIVLPEVSELTLPTDNNILLAKESKEKLSEFVSSRKNVRFQILDDENNLKEVFLIPASVVGLLLNVLRETAKGNAITIIPNNTYSG